mmetsp:Transcript_763/g.1939  ORF Transcript_763/g.1939 Transcript_763/m.1939 type:complete len:309 (+) Transcript_763:2596-3522(+)
MFVCLAHAPRRLGGGAEGRAVNEPGLPLGAHGGGRVAQRLFAARRQAHVLNGLVLVGLLLEPRERRALQAAPALRGAGQRRDGIALERLREAARHPVDAQQRRGHLRAEGEAQQLAALRSSESERLLRGLERCLGDGQAQALRRRRHVVRNVHNVRHMVQRLGHRVGGARGARQQRRRAPDRQRGDAEAKVRRGARRAEARVHARAAQPHGVGRDPQRVHPRPRTRLRSGGRRAWHRGGGCGGGGGPRQKGRPRGRVRRSPAGRRRCHAVAAAVGEAPVGRRRGGVGVRLETSSMLCVSHVRWSARGW